MYVVATLKIPKRVHVRTDVFIVLRLKGYTGIQGNITVNLISIGRHRGRVSTYDEKQKAKQQKKKNKNKKQNKDLE